MKYIKIFLLSALVAALFSGCAYAAGKIPSKIGVSECEMTLCAKKTGKLLDAFLNSEFVRKFSESKLFPRFTQSLAYQKYEQASVALKNSFGGDFKYSRLLDFLDCDIALHIVNSDLDALLLMAEADRNISKYEYFIKFKKGLKTEKVGDTTIYLVNSADDITVFCFAPFQNKTYFSNSFDLLSSVVSKNTVIEAKPVTKAPALIFINLRTLTARLTDNFKKNEGIFLYLFPPSSESAALNIAAFNGITPPGDAEAQAAVKAFNKVTLPLDLPAFSFSNENFTAANFFGTALGCAESLEVSADFTAMLSKFSSVSGRGLSVILDSAVKDSLQFIVSFGVETPDAMSQASFKKYFPDIDAVFSKGRLILSNKKIEASAYKELNFDWLNAISRSLDASGVSYFYCIRGEAFSAALGQMLNMMLDLKNWKSSDAYEFSADLADSLEIFKAFAHILVFSPAGGGVKNLNSSISVSFK